MEVFATVILGLIIVNATLFAVIAMVTLDNPFKMGVLVSVALANCGVFFLAAVLTVDSPGKAMTSFGGKMLPFATIVLGLVALFLVQMKFPAKKRG